MAQLKITELSLDGIKIIEPTYFEDFRGYYCETYSSRTMSEYGLNYVFVQDSHSFSLKKGTIRGIHFQKNPKAQTKLVRCTRGRVMDFAVDLRQNSPTFKQWVSVELSADNRKQILIPKGFGHAFITLEDNCEVQYKVDELYSLSTTALSHIMTLKSELNGAAMILLFLKRIRSHQSFLTAMWILQSN